MNDTPALPESFFTFLFQTCDENLGDPARRKRFIDDLRCHPRKTRRVLVESLAGLAIRAEQHGIIGDRDVVTASHIPIIIQRLQRYFLPPGQSESPAAT